jgi:2-oxoglutarate dehydrogenase E2 component (dihydrolipoamide succinyltransferase)
LNKEQDRMAIDVTMPQLGESITEGTVSKWLKHPGDVVRKYEPLLEVTTDKVDDAIPAPGDGTLLEILVQEGQTVRVGTLLARLGAQDSTDRGESSRERAAPGSPSAPEAPQPPGGKRPPVSPVVARMLAEHGLDLSQIPGTGLGGRVSKQDVLRFLEATGDRQAARGGRQQGAEPASNDAEAVAPPQRSTAPALQGSNVQMLSEELVPLTQMRRSIAEHMQRSVRTAPHVTSIFEVDASRIVAHREREQAGLARQGIRLTYTAYFVQAAAHALRRVPLLNARYSDEGIVMHRQVHIGVAVALDEGLIVPVVRDADEKSLAGLARAVADLAERARARQLRPEETRGGTFTISNYGSAGSLIGTPIINQPQSGILGAGAIVKRPVVVSVQGQDLIAIRPMCYLALTFDHRLIDGALGDAFLSTVKQFVEEYPV